MLTYTIHIKVLCVPSPLTEHGYLLDFYLLLIYFSFYLLSMDIMTISSMHMATYADTIVNRCYVEAAAFKIVELINK